MNVVPTWDLLITTTFVIVVAYSAIIGRNSTMKVVFSTYVGAFCADAIGNLLYRLGYTSGASIGSFLFNGPEAVVLLKIVVMVVIIVAMMLRGTFSVEMGESGTVVDTLALLLLGVLSAGLIVTIILIFISGGAFLTSGSIGVTDLAVNIYNSSQLAQLIINNSSFLIALPGLAFILMSWVTE